MKVNKVTSVEDHKIVSSFQTLRKTLLDDRYADRLEKPLAYWASPNDRRLPLAFLGRTIKDLLDTPFEELSATPGIGQKKISSLVKLLTRTTKDNPPAVPFGLPELTEASSAAAAADTIDGDNQQFDASTVSEAVWSQWQQTVIEHGVGSEKLGLLAPTLQELPTVIWHTPLNHYVHHDVAEIRQFKTHGEKRVRVVLEVFHLVHQMLSGKTPASHFALRIVPRFVLPIEEWIEAALARTEPPSADEIRDRLVIPLLDQIRIDAGDANYDLCVGRLGISGPPLSVREQSRRLGVTRARVYQLFDDCGRVMDVRWPQGKFQLAPLGARVYAESHCDEAKRLFAAMVELFYPGQESLEEDEHRASDNGAETPVEQARGVSAGSHHAE